MARLQTATVVGAALILPVLLGCISFVLEYQVRFFSNRVGLYLLYNNDQRPTRGVVWETIRGNRSGRRGLRTARPEAVESGGIPAALLSWDYRVELSPTSLVLESSPRDNTIDPGDAGRSDTEALATSLRAYRRGQDLLHRVDLESSRYSERAGDLLDSLLEEDHLVSVIDERLVERQDPSQYLLSSLSASERSRWLHHLKNWRRGQGGYVHSGLEKLRMAFDTDRSSRQGRTYRRICRELTETWADSLYTIDFLRLTDGWSKGGGFSAVANREAGQWRGRAYLGNGDILDFRLPAASEPDGLIDTAREASP